MKKYNATKRQKKRRSELGKINYHADKRGVDRKGKDYDHSTGRYIDSSKNRGKKKCKKGTKDCKSRAKGSKRGGEKKKGRKRQNLWD